MAGISDLAGLNLGGEELTLSLLIMLVIVMIWKLVWYGIAIYKTIERKQIRWFVVLFVAAFVLGDLGLLAIIYLLIYKRSLGKPVKPTAKSAKSKPKKK